ncbi:MAG: 4-hydroxyphenylpyruvate dioxygenase [Planctomycetota bacterium]|nr:MAG: 4-hydroxyphenylpyruvate dioxygenase [Planctomycetota bacterium]
MANQLGIRRFDYVEFYSGSAKMATYWHARALGLALKAYQGPETGCRDRVSYYLESKYLKVVVTGATCPENHEVAGFVYRHGDGVRRYALEVEDVEKAYQYAVSHRGIPSQKPRKIQDDYGYVTEAAIKIYDDCELVFINYDDYNGPFKPGYAKPIQNWELHCEDTGIFAIDHIVGNVRENEMNFWAEYFEEALDFETFIYFGPGDISTQYSALLSKVVRSKDGIIKNPINEPYKGKRKSQIQEYIEEYRGTGIQHAALVTSDIVSSIRAMRRNGMEFLTVPDTYYEDLEKKLKKEGREIKEKIEDLHELGILCDVEGQGYLLQLFTKPIFDRPSFFYEIIQRCEGATGFGQGNFQALFESIERDQALRGNL